MVGGPSIAMGYFMPRDYFGVPTETRKTGIVQNYDFASSLFDLRASRPKGYICVAANSALRSPRRRGRTASGAPKELRGIKIQGTKPNQ
jgi:hypothetical protein